MSISVLLSATRAMLLTYPFYRKRKHGTIESRVLQFMQTVSCTAKMWPQATWLQKTLSCYAQNKCVWVHNLIYMIRKPSSHFLFVSPCPDRVPSRQSFLKKTIWWSTEGEPYRRQSRIAELAAPTSTWWENDGRSTEEEIINRAWKMY